MLEPLYMFVILTRVGLEQDARDLPSSRFRRPLPEFLHLFSITFSLFFFRQPVIALYSQAYFSAGFSRPAPSLVYVFPERMSGIG